MDNLVSEYGALPHQVLSSQAPRAPCGAAQAQLQEGVIAVPVPPGQVLGLQLPHRDSCHGRDKRLLGRRSLQWELRGADGSGGWL